MNKLDFGPGEDRVFWKFGALGRFTVKSVYNALTIDDSGPYHKNIWKAKIPAKIKIFLWLLMNNAILTRDNILKRKGKVSPTCHFCNLDETISHLFFQCTTAKVVWTIVAKCFGADNVPRSISQCWLWCDRWLPFGKQFHTVGVAAICWAI
jgi:hypothetical protein